MSRINFYHTTMTLDSILRALQISQDDIILDVIGSSDPSHAMAEIAGQIVSVDRLVGQVDYGRLRQKQIIGGDFKGFLSVGEVADDFELALERRNKYFLEDGRLQRIADRADVISFEQGDIFQVARDNPGRFTKVNASNVFGYSRMHPQFYPERMADLANSLVRGGLLYVADQNDMERMACRRGVRLSVPESLQQDSHLTSIARKHEDPKFWTPVVYKKI